MRGRLPPSSAAKLEGTMRRLLSGLTVVALALASASGHAEIPGGVLRVGILNDMNGPFSAQSGPGSVVAAQLAAEDFAAEAGGLRVEILSADHQNKPDIGATIVRQWIDRDGVTAVADVPNSGVGLAVNQVVREKHRTFVASNVGTSDLTGKFCAPTTVQWSMDTWAFGNAVARAEVEQGGKTWFFVTVDYALGTALQRDASAALTGLGGQVNGAVRVPLGTTDFSAYLVQAQASGAQVVALATTGADLINAVKQAGEFGLTRSQTLAALLVTIADVDAVGLAAMHGVLLAESYYWDLNDATRAFAARFAARMAGRVPTANQAAVYGSVLAYLRAAKAADSIEGERVIAQMQKAPIQDQLYGEVVVRKDGRAVHPMYVFRVKSPAASKSRWDAYELVATIPADLAFRPLAQGGCSLVAK
jgi:branched-chain amino acid transport system substrate-binding protein